MFDIHSNGHSLFFCVLLKYYFLYERNYGNNTKAYISIHYVKYQGSFKCTFSKCNSNHFQQRHTNIRFRTNRNDFNKIA